MGADIHSWRTAEDDHDRRYSDGRGRATRAKLDRWLPNDRPGTRWSLTRSTETVSKIISKHEFESEIVNGRIIMSRRVGKLKQ